MGSPLVARDGVPVKLETRKSLALLIHVALGSRPLPRESLAALFWPEYGQERASANLRRALASLRSALGGEAIRSDRDTVELACDRIVDRETFARLLAEVRKHRHDAPERCPRCRPLLEQAAGLYRGEFLEGFNLRDCPEFDRWQLFERDGLRQEVSKVLELLTGGYGGERRFPEAVETARRWLSLDELHEPAHRALMSLYAALGRPSAALRQYELCRERLREELDQEPEERTTALYDRIRLRKMGGEEEGIPLGTAPAPDLAAAVPETAPGTAAGSAAEATVEVSAGTAPRPHSTGSATPSDFTGPATAPAGESAESAAESAESAVDGEPFTSLLPPGLVLTKLRRPVLRASSVHRSRLLSLLDRDAGLPLTLLSAPAGFGKTTLLAAWTHRCGFPVAWVSLDKGDNDPIRFLSYLAAALSALSPELGTETLQMLRSPQLPPIPFVLSSIINALDRNPAESALVLDDYHLITNREVHDCTTYLIEHLPPRFRLVIATRADPPLPLARLRGRGGIVEIRAEDLRFSPSEAEEFLRTVMALEVSAEEVDVLSRRTEGWAAGLQMAALSLRGRTDRAEFVRTFGGSHRYIMDYLMEEVLRGQSEDVLEFLSATAVLDRLCGELCDAMTGRTGSQAVLESLDAANLFLVPLDEERRWYRYHHLFADLLRSRLPQFFSAEQVKELHLRAGGWFEESGDIEEAVRHYLEGPHYEEAMRLLERSFMEMLTRGQLRTLIGWTGRIPVELVRPRPGICVALGWTYAWAGKREEAERYLDFADRGLLGSSAGDPAALPWSPEERVLYGTSSAIRAFVVDMAGETARAVELVGRADELLPAEDHLTRAILPYILGKAYRYDGQLGLAEKYGSEFLRIARATGILWPVSGAMHEMVWVYRMQGRLRKADELLSEFDQLIAGLRHLGPVAKVIAHRAEILREKGELAEAGRVVEKAVEEVERWGLPSDVFFCHLTRARTRLSSGDPESAAQAVARMDEVSQTRLVYASMLPLLEAERVRVFLATGDLDRARSWVKTYAPPRSEGQVSRDFELITLARIRIAEVRLRATDEALHAALDILDPLVLGAEQNGHAGRLLEMLILKSACLILVGREDEALSCLSHALEAAGSEGYCRVFLDEGEPVLRLLARGIATGCWKGKPAERYARRLLAGGSSPSGLHGT